MSEIDISNIRSDIRKVDGSQLLVFREVLRCRNATEAARRLNLSQSAVSHALSRLRDLFDDPLFVRRPHGLQPTARALDLAPRLEALLELTADMLGLHETFDPHRGTRQFRVAAPEFVTALFGAPLIERLTPYGGNVSFECHHLTPGDALDGLRRGDVDVALGRFDGSPLGDFAVGHAFDDAFCVVARSDHPAVGARISRAKYEALAHVWAASYSEVLPSDAKEDFGVLTTAAVVPQWLTALALVAASDALATCPRRLAERHAGTLKLKVLALPWRAIPFSVYVVRRGKGRDPGVDWFTAQLLAAIG